MQAVTTIGLDIAKSAAGQVLIRRQLKRRAGVRRIVAVQ
jgi:hypothetical protein